MLIEVAAVLLQSVLADMVGYALSPAKLASDTKFVETEREIIMMPHPARFTFFICLLLCRTNASAATDLSPLRAQLSSAEGSERQTFHIERAVASCGGTDDSAALKVSRARNWRSKILIGLRQRSTLEKACRSRAQRSRIFARFMRAPKGLQRCRATLSRVLAGNRNFRVRRTSTAR